MSWDEQRKASCTGLPLRSDFRHEELVKEHKLEAATETRRKVQEAATDSMGYTERWKNALH